MRKRLADVVTLLAIHVLLALLPKPKPVDLASLAPYKMEPLPRPQAVWVGWNRNDAQLEQQSGARIIGVIGQAPRN